MESVEKQTGKVMPELRSVQVPILCEHIYEVFWKIQSVDKIKFSEIAAYSQMTGDNLIPWEVEAIMAMDREYQSFSSEKIRMATNA